MDTSCRRPSPSADWSPVARSAHLEERHQWGGALGVEDTLFITNEWTSSRRAPTTRASARHRPRRCPPTPPAPSPAASRRSSNSTAATPTTSASRCRLQRQPYVDRAAEAARKNAMVRSDGTDYAFPKYVVPARVTSPWGQRAGRGGDRLPLAQRPAYGKVYGFGDVASTTAASRGLAPQRRAAGLDRQALLPHRLAVGRRGAQLHARRLVGLAKTAHADLYF